MRKATVVVTGASSDMSYSNVSTLLKWSRLAGHSDNLINYQGGQYGQEEGSQNIQRRV